MILTLDIGNSAIAYHAVEDGQILFSAELSSARSRTASEYAVFLDLVAQHHGIEPRKAEGAIIASVVPQLTGVLREAITLSAGVVPLVVGPGIKTGLNIRLDDPSQLGADFVAAAVSVMGRYKLPCVVIDMSTAIALGVVDSRGSYVGGIIAPGISVALDGLAAGASQLPHVSSDAPAQVIGRSTEASIRSGVIYGSAALLDGLLERIEAQLGEPVTAVATGSDARSVIPHCRRKDIQIDGELIPRGLWLIYQKNRKERSTHE